FNVASFHHRFDAVVGGLALLFNLGLLYLIVKQGSQHLKEYKWVLLSMCVSDIVLSTVVFVSNPAILPMGGYVMIVSNGWFAGNNVLFDHAFLAGFCAMLHTNIICIVVQFVYRYRLICRSHCLKEPSHVIFVWPVLWCILQASNSVWCLVFGQGAEQREIGLEILREISWQYDSDHAPYPSVTHWSEVRTKVHHLIYMISCIGGYTTIVWCECHIMKYLKRNQVSMHSRTRRMHADVNRALVALAIAPLLASTGPTALIVSLMVFRVSPGSIAAYITLGTSLITLINPLTTIYFVRSFRRVVANKLGFNWSVQVSAISSEPEHQAGPHCCERVDRF
ncbi:7TM GPCR protein, partial [Aphelenchoides avenae]